MTEKRLTHLEKLKAQQTKITAQIQAAEAQVKASERKQETRRKFLVGAYHLEEARKHNQFEALKKAMQGYLTRNSDRALFDLPNVTETKTD